VAAEVVVVEAVVVEAIEVVEVVPDKDELGVVSSNLECA
jgi:hypothetical protein